MPQEWIASKQALKRRSFVKWTAAAMAMGSPALRPLRAAASDRISLGFIGLGARGFQLLGDFLAQATTQVLAVCDVQEVHYRDNPWGQGPQMGSVPAQARIEKHYAEATKSGRFQGSAAYADYRDVLARAGSGCRGHRYARPLACTHRPRRHSQRQGCLLRKASHAFFCRGSGCSACGGGAAHDFPSRLPAALRPNLSSGGGVGPQREAGQFARDRSGLAAGLRTGAR